MRVILTDCGLWSRIEKPLFPSKRLTECLWNGRKLVFGKLEEWHCR